MYVPLSFSFGGLYSRKDRLEIGCEDALYDFTCYLYFPMAQFLSVEQISYF